MNTSNGQPSALTIFETALWPPGHHRKVCLEGVPHPAQGLALGGLQHTWFPFFLPQILHRRETVVFGFFPPTLLCDFRF
jgi:hypothetical protein